MGHFLQYATHRSEIFCNREAFVNDHVVEKLIVLTSIYLAYITVVH
jgi:hypothetical protein